MAQLFDCSPRMTEMKFKRATGHSIQDEILSVRLEKAFSYLRNKDLPINAVADFCGWKSCIAFRKLFKKRTGLTPGAWRRAQTPDGT
ncbi:MAG: AraC family transcriptional regulator [Kiritimatiellia bacterium]